MSMYRSELQHCIGTALPKYVSCKQQQVISEQLNKRIQSIRRHPVLVTSVESSTNQKDTMYLL